MELQHCCKEMWALIQDEPVDGLSEGDTPIGFIPKFREYGLKIPGDGISARQDIRYCPWCGFQLPKSLRDQWFDILEKLGIDDPWVQEIPGEFKTEEWWIERGL
ncbi:MAG: hypothetical protein OEM27_06830 [Nitrospinota bacterium]|nr:hypothetical protein [Nitrospinota bacterium]